MSFQPQTPQSPSQFSPKVVTDSLPSVNSSMSFIASLPTPAHSVNGSNLTSDASHDNSMGEESPQKRKRLLEDVGGHSREQKKLHTEDDGPSIENLHLDVGEKYLVLSKPFSAAKVPLSEDLFEMFDLTGIARDVARVLPDGTKNGLRKTYKGQIKKLDLEGHFDSVKKDENAEDGFMRLAYYPAEEWGIHHVSNKDITAGLNLRSLTNALNMARGPIPKDKWDQSVLGELAADKVTGNKQSSSAKATAPSTPAASGIIPRTKAQGLAAQEAVRPHRSGKKRNYGDNSYEGYDGYGDDTGPETGYSTGEGEAAGQKGAALKRRKKVLRTLVSVFITEPLLTSHRTRTPYLGHLDSSPMVLARLALSKQPTRSHWRLAQISTPRRSCYRSLVCHRAPSAAISTRLVTACDYIKANHIEFRVQHRLRYRIEGSKEEADDGFTVINLSLSALR